MLTIQELGTSSVDVGLIPLADIPKIFPNIQSLLVENPAELLSYYTVDDVYERLLTGAIDLWVGISLRRIEGATLAAVEQYPAKRIYRILWTGGKNVHKFLKVGLYKMENYALVQGAVSLETEGRIGWDRLLGKHGYETSVRFGYSKALRMRGH